MAVEEDVGGAEGLVAGVMGSGRRGQMLYRMSSHLLGGSAERFTALVDGMRKE